MQLCNECDVCLPAFVLVMLIAEQFTRLQSSRYILWAKSDLESQQRKLDGTYLAPLATPTILRPASFRFPDGAIL